MPGEAVSVSGVRGVRFQSLNAGRLPPNAIQKYRFFQKERERDTSMIRFDEVSKVFGGEHVAVDRLTATVEDGQLAVIIGPSGCGKTTTLQMVNRLIEPTSGRIYVNERDHSSFDAVKLRRTMGYVIQEIGLFPHMTVGQNITIVPDLEGWSQSDKTERARELIDMVGMDPGVYLDRYPRELSGGQQQRIGVLRALAVDPDILLMDEPFGALDPLTRDQLQDELTDLQERVKKTILFVTHDMDEALKMGDMILMMQEGKLLQFETPEEILRNPNNEFIAEFIGAERMILSPLDVQVKEVMFATVPEVREATTLGEAVRAMREADTDYVFVVDGRGKFVGLADAPTLGELMDEQGKELEVGEAPLNPTCIEQRDNIMEAVHLLVERESDVIGVVDKGRRPTGTFTRGSLPRILADKVWPRDAAATHSAAEEAGGSQ